MRLPNRVSVLLITNFIFFVLNLYALAATFGYSNEGSTTGKLVDKEEESEFVDDYRSLAAKVAQFQESLFYRIRIACLVPSAVNNIVERSAVRETWGPRCNKLIFTFGDKINLKPIRQTDQINYVKLNMSDGSDDYYKNWEKSVLSFRYVYDHYLNDIDWVIRTDDDAYLELTNMRLFLSNLKQNDSDAHYYGAPIHHYSTDYNQGGVGYLLSRNVLKKLVEVGFDQGICDISVDNRQLEDHQMAVCLRQLNVTIANTTDESGRLRFSMTNLYRTMASKAVSATSFFWAISSHKFAEGVECCSDSAVGFHQVSPFTMRMMDYLINIMSPFQSRQNSTLLVAT